MGRTFLVLLAFAPAFVAAVGDRASGQRTERVSIDSAGTQGDQPSSGVNSMSADGRFVAFSSVADNLVAGDGNWKVDVFVHDRLLGTTERVSVNSSGVEGNGDSIWPAVSADGRLVAFASYASNLVYGDTNGSGDVFVHDRQTGITERVSVDSSGNEGAWESFAPAISDDGNFVAFASIAYNLVSGDTNHCRDNFVRDRQAGTTERVSVDSAGAEGNGASGVWTSISADGRFVGFNSDATNLVSGDTNNLSDAFLRDRQAGTTERVSVDSAGKQGKNYTLGKTSISADGRFVAFDSDAVLASNDAYSGTDIYVRDRQNGKTRLMSVDSAGNGGNGRSRGPSISAHGRYVAFDSDASNLVPGDTNSRSDVFLHDRNSGTTTRVSVDSSGGQGDWGSYSAFFSSDARFVSFGSDSTNLVGGDTNRCGDTFVHGPWLILEVDPAAPPPGATLAFTSWTGLPSGAALLAVTAVNGTATFVPAVFGSFDAAGLWTWSATVPSGLSGSVLTFTTLGFVPTGNVEGSNEVDVSFQ